jgi:3-dehydroquinate synthase II
VKELWIRLDSKALQNEKLVETANKLGDVILENRDGKISVKKSDFIVLDDFDEKSIKQIKNEGKKVALNITIRGKEDENNAIKASALSVDYIILNTRDWRVIPLENLIARNKGQSKLIPEVANSEEARLVLETLELGTDGVMINTENVDELEKTADIVKQKLAELQLAVAKITSTKQIGTGARACVDTCDLMYPGEGLLIGSQSAGLFLVEAEVHENPYVASRPFRVNAGSISMYTLGDMENTRYLSELKAGDEVVVVSREGKTRKACIGRVKIEFRPLILLEAEINGKIIKAVLQNAETIRVVNPKGSTPVTELQKGDEVTVYLAAKGGRHFGVSVTDETVIER